MSKKLNRFPEILGTMMIIAFLSMLLGCGPQNDSSGGTTGTGTGTGTGTTTGSITLSLTKLSDNSPTTSVSTDSPAKLTATAKNSNGSAIVGTVVAFSTTWDLVFNPALGTALTDANGTASITVNAANTTGAATIKADTTDASGAAVSGTIGLSVTSPNLSLSAMTITPAILSAGGSAGVSVTVNDGSGNPFTTSVPVSFTSNGVQTGKATITQQVYTVNGVASATYRDINYGAVDTITATLSIGGTTFTKTGTITVNTASAGSISFVSATPPNIALKGTGGAGRSETSVVLFKVLDSNGNPINKKVNFSLLANTTVGGLSLSTTSADSDPVSGSVQTIVNAGTQSTPVRVTATIDGTTIQTTSDLLVISTGIPDQNSFSLSATPCNIEGLEYDDETSDVKVKMADHFNNPVPDGTAVNFRTSGASIPASCTTTNGACTVKFTSQEPRPANGRCVILAYALGEESFTDLNANGIYDPGTGETFTDMPEPFLDANENFVKDADEDFIDTGAVYPEVGPDGLYSPGDGIFNGILRASSITGPTTIHVRGSHPLILSGSFAFITLSIGNSINLTPYCTDGLSTPYTTASAAFGMTIADVNGNAMPSGTTVTLGTTNGRIVSKTNFTMLNNCGTAPTYLVIMESDATQDKTTGKCTNTKTSGLLTIEVTTPKGNLTTYYFPVYD